MTNEIELEALDLAALLCSRVCHDIISPVGAINNGLEVLDEENGEEMKAFAFDLIRKSARQASAKLQFARLAFGAAGSAGAEIDIGDAEKVARGYMEGEKASFEWTAPRALMPKNQVKLILNLVLMAVAAVPRGGLIKVTITGEPAKPEVTFHCSGPSARIPAAFEKLIPGAIVDVNIDAHAVQPYYAGLLARVSGMTVAAVLDGADVIITARPAAAEVVEPVADEPVTEVTEVTEEQAAAPVASAEA
ncbi:histidine phosphotransferase ChpT [Kaistia adipata]|uniref:histidine phosphotransferase ChpT n=1 Tax=Kaistia adipata TaxID=166954 RepID=UPI000401B054|nr:histidine phosphotransferase family protein [Kaistia adipata]